MALFLAALWRERREPKNLINMQITRLHERLLVGCLFVFGILVRVLCLTRYPCGLNQDEASIGYDAFADLTYGMDRNGYHNPVYSVAWGSGHSGLYILLLKLAIRCFGLSVFAVRLPNAVFASAALFAFYGFIKQLRGRRTATILLFLLVINPWHIMMARWGLECNIFPNIFIWGLYFLARAQKQELWYVPTLAVFGLSLYGYGTAYMFVPVFLPVCAICLMRRGTLHKPMLMASAAVFCLTAVPIGIFMLVNVCGLPEQDWGFLSFPRLIDGRYNTTVTVLGGDFFKNCLSNVATLVRLLATQRDGLIWNSIPAFGTLYLFSLPLAFGGLYVVLRHRQHPLRPFVLAMTVAALVLATLSELNINRANIIYVLLLVGLAEGVCFVGNRFRYAYHALTAAYAVAFALFAGCYCGGYQAQIGTAFFEGFGEAIQQAAHETDGTIYLTESVNAPYIYVLFYEQTDPRLFLDTVVYENPNSSVRRVASFGRYVTGLPQSADPDKQAVYIANHHEAAAFDDRYFSKTTHGHYEVIRPNYTENEQREGVTR